MKYFSELAKLRTEIDVYKVFTFLFALVIAFQSYIIGTANKNKEILVVPSNISKSFSYVKNSFSKEYFDDVGFLISSTLFTVSDTNVDASFSIVSKYFTTDPIDRKEIIDMLNENAKNIKNDNISQAFYPKKVRVDYDKRQFSVDGTLKTISGNLVTGNERRTLNFFYKVRSGHLLIYKFEAK